MELPWNEKNSVTFSDMLTAARTDILSEPDYTRPDSGRCEHLLWPIQLASMNTHGREKRRAA
jgi:hypothetical protein